MTKNLNRHCTTTLALAIAGCALAAQAAAMDIEVRPPFVVLTGIVTGIELRLLKDAVADNSGITTVVLKDSPGGDARTGFLVGEYIRQKGLNTAVSGYCRSSCSRMFLGGAVRSISSDQPIDKTYVAFHGNYGQDGSRIYATGLTLKNWVTKYSDGKANPLLVDQWISLENRRGFAYFFHPQASVDAGSDRVLLCKGDEEPQKRLQLCAKPELGNALDNGILTTLEIVKMNKQQPQQQQEQAKP